METSSCERCGAPFPLTKASRRFCSERCRRLAEEARYRKAHPARRPPRAGAVLFICDRCGQPETAKHRGRHAKPPICAACKRQTRRDTYQPHSETT